jgi:hypothetical protein
MVLPATFRHNFFYITKNAAMEDNRKRNRDRQEQKSSDEELPGYPHYPSEDDIMNPQHGFKKIPADEELANSRSISGRTVTDKEEITPADDSGEDDDLKIVSGTEADVTEEDLQLLGDRDADQDMGDDEETRTARVDELEEEGDLDIPGAAMNDEEALGQDDEENNYYSLGGDRHENLEEDPPGDKE